MRVITAHWLVERILLLWSLRRGGWVGGRVLDLVLDLPSAMVLRLRVMAAAATVIRMWMMLAMLVTTSLVAPLLLMMLCLHHWWRLTHRRWLE